MSAELRPVDIESVRQWMKWFPQKYREGEHTSVMSLEEDAVYRRLLDAMWVSQVPVGSMPMEDRQIAALARCSASEWRRVKVQVLKCFVDGGDGRWHQPDQKAIWLAQCEAYQTSRDRARKGGLASAEKRGHGHQPKLQPKLQPEYGLEHRLEMTGAPLAKGVVLDNPPPPRPGRAAGVKEFSPPETFTLAESLAELPTPVEVKSG